MLDNQSSYFSLSEHPTPTSNDLTITFTPGDYVTKYEIIILKDEKEYHTNTVDSETSIDILLNETGKYQIKVITYDIYNQINEYHSGYYLIDKDKPVIKLEKTAIDLPLGSTFSILEGVKAYDEQEGDLTEFVRTNSDELDLATVGTKTLVYTVSDSAGNIATATATINVYENQANSILALRYLLLSVILLVILMLYRYRRGLKLEQRLARYSINPVSDNDISLGDKIVNYYTKIIKKISTILRKSTVITNHSKRYNHYVNIVNDTHNSGLDFISEKIITAISFVLIAFIYKLIRYELLSFYNALIPLLLGFFTPNLVYVYKYRSYRNRLENDFLQAITIMNNAFKSGCSIVQAIELVSRELDGPISFEFKKMLMEINFGLPIDVVFERFSERVKLEEATYLTVTLMILNRTGGNIIKVFSSIEKTLYNRKKLKLEFRALTGSSKIVVALLSGLPIVFMAIINIINPNYFAPLYTTNIGKIILGIIVAIYLGYIYVIQKFIRVRL